MHKDMFEKFFHFAHDILENREELGLSPETAKKVLELKISTKKDKIRDAAEVELLLVDIAVELWKDKPDLGAVNKLLDKKYDLKKASMKSLVAAFVAVKKLLSPVQVKKVMAICKAHQKPGESRA